jgi:histidinol-phosphate aminotransferase
MSVSRRSFLKSAGVGGVGALTLPLIAARGSEGARGMEFAAGEGLQPFAADERARLRLRVADPIRLDSNENPNGPGARVLDAVRAMFGEAPRYPDVPTVELQRAIAAHHKVAPEQVLVGCGSGEVLRMASYAFTGPQRALVTGAPSFEDPTRHSQMMSAEIRAVPVDAKLALDLDGMLAAVRGAGLVFLCNPNNPTSTVHGASAVRAFIEAANRANPDAIVMVDEAYHEYVDDPAYASMLPEALQNPRVIVVRTFSKVYGMAGLRAGYAIGNPDVLRQMQRHRLPNSINVLAAAGAIATLSDAAHLERERQANRAARSFTRKAFEGMGFTPAASHTNFLMVPIGRDARAFRDACARHGILVGRLFPPLTTHARVSIGTMDEMKRAVDVFRQVLSASAD